MAVIWGNTLLMDIRLSVIEGFPIMILGTQGVEILDF